MRIGPYKLIRKLGQGGMAQVWLAHRINDVGGRRPCVVKFPLKQAVADETAMRQFGSEVEVSTSLVHNNIISAFDHGEHEGLPYLVMDYVPGVDLEQLHLAVIRGDDTWDVETAVHIIREVAAGLGYAHNRTGPGVPNKIIHRDVGAKNVMIDGDGGVRIMDFGVATSPSMGTSKMHVKGTLRYMAPEHYLANATAASDVFSLGVLFWELLSGKICRDGAQGTALVEMVVHGKVEPLQRDVPASVRNVLDGMLRPDAAERLTLARVFSTLERFPVRRKQLKRTLERWFGSAGKSTGHSQGYFSAAPELDAALAVARVARSSPPQSQDKTPNQGRPDPVPIDFVPTAGDRTSRLAPNATDQFDDELDAAEPQTSPHEQPGSPRATPEATIQLRRHAAAPAGARVPTAVLSGRAPAASPADNAGEFSPRSAQPTAPSSTGAKTTRTRPRITIPPVVPEERPLPTDITAPAPKRRRILLVFAGVLLVTTLVGLGILFQLKSDPSHVVEVDDEPRRIATNEPPEIGRRTDSNDEIPEIEFPPSPVAAAPPASVVAEPKEDEEQPEPKPQEPPAEPTQPAVDDKPKPVAKAPKPTTRPPGPKIEVIIRRGLAVTFAQVRVGKRGKIQTVPSRGGIPLHLRVGTHTVWWRNTPDGKFQPKRFRVTGDKAYAGNVEVSGLRISATAKGNKPK